VPIFYNTNLTQIPNSPNTRYWDESSAPLYPFGYGLSYAKFALDHLRLDATSLAGEGTLHATVDVHNSSAVAADEVVQMYTHQRAGSASRPVRELKGFQKVHLAAHETRTVTLDLPAASLSFWSPATHKNELEPGDFDLWVGDSSDAPLHTTFRLNR